MPLRSIHRCQPHPNPSSSQPSILPHRPSSPATHRPNLHSVPLTEHFYHSSPPSRQPRTDLPDSDSTPPHPTLHTTPTLTRPQPHPQLRHHHPLSTHPHSTTLPAKHSLSPTRLSSHTTNPRGSCTDRIRVRGSTRAS